jgi:orotidine-5'-phosphate decarboxylase
VKPQSAFFELYGSAGIAALERVVAHAHERELVVIEDAKRNDIGNTARAYAAAHLGEVAVPGGMLPSTISADFLTVSPYEGAEGLDPFIETASEQGRGAFVLVKTSNPGSLLVQGAMVRSDDAGADAERTTVYESLARYVASFADGTCGACGYSGIGAVVGATYPEQAHALRAIMPNSFFLVPGYGAQGAGAREVVPCFNADGLGAVVNSSRGIIFAYERGPGRACTREEFRTATHDAAVAMRDDIVGTLREDCLDILY